MAKKLIREMRKAAIKLYGEKCVYCDGDKNLTADHLLPRSLHGSSHLINIVISCAACNLQKDNKLPSELSLPDSIVTKIRTVQEKLLPNFQQLAHLNIIVILWDYLRQQNLSLQLM